MREKDIHTRAHTRMHAHTHTYTHTHTHTHRERGGKRKITLMTDVQTWEGNISSLKCRQRESGQFTTCASHFLKKNLLSMMNENKWMSELTFSSQ